MCSNTVMQYLLRVIILIASCYPVGFLFLHFFGKSFTRMIGNKKYISITAIFGLIVCSLIMLFFGLMGVSFRLLTYGVPLLSVGFILLLIYKGRIDTPLDASFSLFIQRDFIIELLFLGFSIVFFSIIGELMKWSPPGDPASLGTFTSLFLLNDKIPASFEPFSSLAFNVWQYPPLFIVSSVFATLWTGLYPGEAMLLLAIFTSSLIPVLVSSIVLNSTRSFKLALSSFLLSFIVPGFMCTLRFRDLLFHNLYNGTFPNHIANLVMVLLFCYFILGQSDNAVFDLSMLVAGVSVVLFYYPYGTYVVILFLWKIFTTANLGASKKWFVLVLYLAIVSIVMLSLLRAYIPPFFRRLFEDYFIRMPFGYKIRLDTMSVEYSLAIVLSSVVSLILFKRSGEAEKSTLFSTAVMVIPILLSMNPGVFNVLSSVLWFFPTRRTWAVFYGVSLVLFFTGLQRLLDRSDGVDDSEYSRYQYVLLIVSLLLFSGVVLNIDAGSWQRPTGEDLQALEWILDNAAIDDLILNDRSYPGLFLTSLRAQNVVNEHFLLIEALGGGPGEHDLSNFRKFQ